MTYEYVCTGCAHEWEAEQRMSDSPLRDCPACGMPHAKRLVSGGVGFVLKGSGWYSDLYGLKPNGTKKAGCSPAAASSSSSKASAGTPTAKAADTSKSTPNASTAAGI